MPSRNAVVTSCPELRITNTELSVRKRGHQNWRGIFLRKYSLLGGNNSLLARINSLFEFLGNLLASLWNKVSIRRRFSRNRAEIE